MTTRIANDAAKIGRDPTGRGVGSGILGRVTTRTRWIVSATVALIVTVVLVAESAAQAVAGAMACIGSGSIMALAASANAFAMIP